MKKTDLTRFDKLMAAVTFAEAGMPDTAREYLREEDRPVKRETGRPEMRKTKTVRKYN